MKTKATAVVLGGMAVLAVAAGLYAAGKGARQDAAPVAAARAAVTKAPAAGEYACPMHPEQTSTKRDRCAICGMYLEAVAGPADAAGAAAEAKDCCGGKHRDHAARQAGHHGKDGKAGGHGCPHHRAAGGGCPHHGKAGAECPRHKGAASPAPKDGGN